MSLVGGAHRGRLSLLLGGSKEVQPIFWKLELLYRKTPLTPEEPSRTTRSLHTQQLTPPSLRECSHELRCQVCVWFLLSTATLRYESPADLSGGTGPKGDLPKVITLKCSGPLTRPCFTAERAQEEWWGRETPCSVQQALSGPRRSRGDVWVDPQG